jgi:hypothetical protein
MNGHHDGDNEWSEADDLNLQEQILCHHSSGRMNNNTQRNGVVDKVRRASKASAFF